MESFHLDYLSCSLSILSTVLVGRKLWFGLIVASFNSVIVCVIGFHTLQFGFIPANLFCIGINVFCIRSWRKDRPTGPEIIHEPRVQAQQASRGPLHGNPAHLASEETGAGKLIEARRDGPIEDSNIYPATFARLIILRTFMWLAVD